MSSSRNAVVLMAVGVLIAPPAGAQPGAQAAAPTDRAAALRALTDCRGVEEPAARLACFDTAAAALDAAERAGEVVVLDREQVRAAKRDAFGFSIPSFNLFDRSESQRTEEVGELESTVASASTDAGGKWVVRLANGQVWRQTDTRSLRVRTGDKAELRRAALGSYMMNIAGRTAVRAERVR